MCFRAVRQFFLYSLSMKEPIRKEKEGKNIHNFSQSKMRVTILGSDISFPIQSCSSIEFSLFWETFSVKPGDVCML